MNKSIFSIFTLLLFGLWTTAPALAQSKASGEAFSLKDCLTYALENNTEVRKQNLLLLQSTQRVLETKAAGLPQVSASVQVLDNLIIGKQLLPGEILGQPGTFIPVRFGVQYAVPLRVEASQVLFNKQYAASVESAKAAELLSQANSARVREDVAYNVASAYYSALITGEQRKIVEANLTKVTQSVQVAQVQYDNQMIRRIDLDQLRVSQSNTRSELDNVQVNYAQALDMLKILMGYPLADTLVLAADLGEETGFTPPVNSTSVNPTLQVLDRQLALKNVEIKGIRAQYLPTIGLIANYGYQGQFDKLDDMTWIPSALVGVSVSIPIFDGNRKKHQIFQRDLELQALSLDRQLAQNQLNVQYQNAVRKYQQNQQTARNQQANLDLAQNVYAAIQNNYKNGIATLSDLINADSGLRGAQTQYLTAQLQMRISLLDLLRANGSIGRELINN